MEQNVAQIATERWNIKLGASILERFNSVGWTYECPVEDQCPKCGTSLEVCRKPYTTSNGTKMKYVALICRGCHKALTLKELGLSGFPQLTKRGKTHSLATTPKDTETRTEPPQPASGKAENIIRFWRAVEFFEAQTVDLPTTEDRAQGAKAHRFSLDKSSPAPWSTQLSQAKPENQDKVPYYTATVGIFKLDALHTTLASVLGESGEDVEERTPRGNSALFSLGINKLGQPDWESLVLASAAWSLGRAIQSTDPQQLDFGGFDAAHEALAGSLADQYCRQGRSQDPSGTADSIVLGSGDVLGMVDHAARFLGIQDELSPQGVVVTMQLIDAEAERPQVQGFLNSFLAEDLERVAVDIARHGAKGALGSYLSAREPKRLDVTKVKNRASMAEILEPRNFPAGRWPTMIDHSLSTSQQLAVNNICRDSASKSAVLGVNGPPGTGKTTLLRELVADQVTQRAMVLADLPSPEAAFTSERLGWSTKDYTHSFLRLDQAVSGKEMIVASANNGAVENVSKEMPRQEDLDARWKGRGYHRSAARRMDPDFWGLLAAALGANSKRRAFLGTAWWGKKEARTGSSGPAFKSDMSARAMAEGGVGWTRALDKFRHAQKLEHDIRSERQDLCVLLAKLPVTRDAGTEGERQLLRARERLDGTLVSAQVAQDSFTAAEARVLELREEHHEMVQLKPDWWESLFDFGAGLRSWRRGFEEHGEIYRSAKSQREMAKDAQEHANSQLSKAGNGVKKRQQERAEQQALIAHVERQCAEARKKVGFQLPDHAWWEDKDRQELECPWADESWNEARSELFLAALELHEAFMVRTWREFSKGLDAAMALVKSRAPEDVPDEVVTEAWRYLFVMVPVVSTTFSSLGRMFQGILPRSLGWLIIDEAGQATPQAAVGGIWRSKNVVAVGDPLQLEPIVAALHSTQAQLRDNWNVDRMWMPGRQTVQGLVDRVTPIGSYLPGADAPLWSGAPLRAHRRCDDPMFSVVNDAVYGGAMVQAKELRRAGAPLTRPDIPESVWIEVPGHSAQGKWRPGEGEALVELVRGLLAATLQVPESRDRQHIPALQQEDILVISPFKQAADRARTLLNSAAVCKDSETGQRITVGTVHTAQGKQAKVVIMVLGSDPNKPGARAWAADKPNLMNVAVSRARHRIFVIGQGSEWADLPYFGDLFHALESIPVTGLQKHLDSAASRIGNRPG